ncbi:MAG TPA: threonine/serine dehydratase [Thermoanaerobaculia bacterium]|jgi:threonine dehydratase|nr:threonine/serine dehydratase [Thermoanaerobaculia bacterium]
MIPLSDIRAAADRIRGHVHRTPLLSSRSIGESVGAAVFLKCESFQKTGSFKPRGALNKVLSLEGEERGRGLVTVSAGNHAQAVAWAARRTGVPCAVVMPAKAPASKVEAVRGYGARIVFHDDNSTLFDRLRQLQEETGYVFVHPFDDPVVLAGAGTAGLEIIEDLPDVSVVVVPVGGGGLMGGVASAVKQSRPSARVYAVELAEGPGLGPALAAGKPVPVPRPAKTLADGLIPPFVGAIPLAIAREALEAVVTVSEAAIASAMRRLLTRAKLYVEGGGAAATAALLSGAIPVEKSDTVAVLVSGGNVDPERFPFAEPAA